MVKIYSLNYSHNEAWTKLWSEYLEFYEVKRSKEIFNLIFSRLVKNYEGCEGYIAFIDGKAVGIIHSLYHIHMWQKEMICYIQDLFVDKKYRNQGVARKLMLKVYARADEKNAKGVYWTTQDYNTTARKLYDKIGIKTPFIKYSRK